MPLIDLEDAKTQLGITGDSTDSLMQTYINAATAVVERHVDKTISETTFTDAVTFPGTVELAHQPVIQLTSVTSSGGTTIDLSQFTLFDGSITSSYVGQVNLAYQAGMVSPPANYELAALIILQHLWQTRRGNMPSSGAALPDSLAYPNFSGYAIPNKALELLGAESPFGFA